MIVNFHFRNSALRIAAFLFLATLAACGRSSPEQLIKSAREYLDRHDYDAALIQLKNVLRSNPDSGEARLLIGEAYLGARDPISAEKELQRAIELRQPNEKVLPLFVRALFEQGKYKEVIGEVEKRVIYDPPALAATMTVLGDTHIALGNSRRAAEAYAAALAAIPGFSRARLGQVTLSAVEGRLDDALAAVDEIIAAAPALAEAHALRSRLLLAKGDRAAARASLEKAVAADAGFLPARFDLIFMLIDDRAFDQAGVQLAETQKIATRDLRVTYLNGLLAFRKDEPQKAREHVQQVLKYAPDNVPSLLLAGAIELQLKNLVLAETYLQHAVASGPVDSRARRLLAATQLRMGQPARARETLQPLLDRGVPADSQLLLLAGETALANGDVKQATAFYQKASSGTEPQQVAARTRLGQIALATGNAEQGFKELEIASELDAGNYQADLARITGHLRRNEIGAAVAAAQALEKKQPKNPLTFQIYGVIHLAQRDVPAARKSFEKALELQPNYLPAAQNLAVMDLVDKRPEDARRRFEAMIAKDPRNDQLHLALADLLARSGAQAADVGATLKRAVEANPQSVPARLALINFRLRDKDAKGALSAAQDASAALPNDVRIVDALGTAQENAGEVNQAIETYNRLAKLTPRAPDPLYRLAALHIRRKESDKAIEALRRTEKLQPSPHDLVPRLVAAYMSAERADDALREVAGLQKREPKFVGSWTLEGDIRVAQKKWPEAERAFREALKLEPRADGVVVRLHGVMTAANKPAEADALVKKWLKENPKNAPVRMYLADLDLRAKNFKSAVAQYQAVLALEPKNVVVMNNLAWALGEMGDPNALAQAERALKLAPGNVAVLNTLGVILVNRGDAKKGLEYLQRATQLAPNRPDIRLYYAKGLIKAGQKDEARKELDSLQAIKDEFQGKSEIAALIKGL